MKIATKLIITILLFISLIGCTSQSQQSNLAGSEGIVMTLGDYPKQIYANQGLEIPITLENNGVSDVQNAVLSLSSPTSIVQFTTPRIEGVNLAGRGSFLTGEKTLQSFAASSIRLGNMNEKEVSFEAAVCYQYNTQASPIVCINPILSTSVQTKGTCTVGSVQLTSTQGAPVAVTKVESTYLSQQKTMQFEIYVKNVYSNGKVVDKNVYSERCLGTALLKEEEYDVVDYEVYLSGRRLDCKSLTTGESDRFTLSSDEHAISCTAQIDPSQGSYTTPLYITLSYGYYITMPFSVDIKSSLTR